MLEALSRQTLSPDRYEVIVVVDGSTDGTVEMLKSLDMPYRLEYVWQDNAGTAATEHSSGVSVARNNGAARATSNVILFLDDDILPMPELLESHLGYYQGDKNVVVLGRLLPADGPGKFAWSRWEERVFTRHYAALHEGRRAASGWRLYSANFSVSRELFESQNGFDVDMGNIRGEDVDLGLRMEQAGAQFRFSWDAAGVHRGFRPFKSWAGSAYILGVRDIELSRRRGYQNIRDQALIGTSRTRTMLRPVIRAYIANGIFRRAADSAIRLAGGTADQVRWIRMADRFYGLLFTMQYWRGISASIGGTANMYREADLAAAKRQAEPPSETSQDRYRIEGKPGSGS